MRGLLRKPPRFVLVGPGRWGRIQVLIGLTIFGAALPRLFLSRSMVGSSYWETYYEERFSFVITIAGVVIGAVAALIVLEYRERRQGTRR